VEKAVDSSRKSRAETRYVWCTTLWIALELDIDRLWVRGRLCRGQHCRVAIP